MSMVPAIHAVVCVCICCLVWGVGAAGLTKSVSFCACLIMPVGRVFDEMALSMMRLWCVT